MYPETSPPSEAFPTSVRDHQPHRPVEPVPSRKKPLPRWIWLAVLVAVTLVVVLVLAGCGTSEEVPQPAPTLAAEKGQTDYSDPSHGAIPKDGLYMTAETTEGAPMNISYIGEGMALHQEDAAPSPWSVSIPAQERLDLLGVNMSALNRGPGDVACRLYWNGDLVAENIAEGQYSIALCTLPMR